MVKSKTTFYISQIFFKIILVMNSNSLKFNDM